MNKNLFEFLTDGTEILKFDKIFENPVVFGIVVLVAIALVVFLVLQYRKEKDAPKPKRKTDVKVLVTGALCISIAFVLSFIKLLDLPQGGALTLASGLPIILFAYLYGPKHGLAAAFAYSLLQLLQGAYTVGIIQFLLDYPLAFTAFGLAGFYRKNIIPGIIAGYMVRLMCHFVSGVVFFGEYAKELGYAVAPYSFMYNAVFLIPEMILCIIIVLIPQVKRMIGNIRKELAV